MSAPFDAGPINAIFADMETRAREQLRGEGFDDDAIELTRSVEMKFSLQIHLVEVPVPEGTLTAAQAEEQVERFIVRYEEIYGEGSAFPDAGTQIGLFKVQARGRLVAPLTPEIATAQAPAAVGSRDVYWRELGDFRATDVYDGSALSAGAAMAGPAIIDYPDTTVVIPPGAEAEVDRLGNVVIDVGSEQPAPSAAAASAAPAV
jgi:N-methylhydantoinase A